MTKKTVYGARVKDTTPVNPKWIGQWHRVKTNNNKAGEWSKRAWAQNALDTALGNDTGLVGHTFDEKVDVEVTLANVKVSQWLSGNVVAIKDVPEEYRAAYRDTVKRAALAAARYGHTVHVNSSFRTRAQQEVLYQRYLNGGPLANRPGTSPHERGIALDIPNVRDNKPLLKQLAKVKLIDDVPSERWHVTKHA